MWWCETRRRLLLAAAATTALLPGCGFRLRGAQSLPFSTIYLNFPPNSALGTELARNIRAGTDAEVVAERGKAQAVFDLLNEVRDREVVALNPQGRAREYQLRLSLVFRVRDAKGGELIPATALTAQREVAFNEAQVLAREAEEVLLYRDMQSDLVQQILRRLAAARLPSG
jgi:LPS-assembly lipoprotein